MNKAEATFPSNLTTSCLCRFWEAYTSCRVNLNMTSLKNQLKFHPQNFYLSHWPLWQQGSASITTPSLGLCALQKPITANTSAAWSKTVHWNFVHCLLLRGNITTVFLWLHVLTRCGIGSLSYMWPFGSTKKKIRNAWGLQWNEINNVLYFHCIQK